MGSSQESVSKEPEKTGAINTTAGHEGDDSKHEETRREDKGADTDADADEKELEKVAGGYTDTKGNQHLG